MIFDRNGQCTAEYDKTHLFSFARENAYFEYGDKTVTFELDGVKCGIIICYDMRFPELARTLALKGIKLLFIPAEWPDTRINHWNVLCGARAIENQIFTACVNSVGKAGKIQYGGNSAVIDPWGEVIAKGGTEEETICADIDIDAVEKVRSMMNIYQDRRAELYEINNK
jgi:predicted amidohydrolase